MTLLIVAAILLLTLLGTPLYAVIGLAALLSFHFAEIDSAAVFIELYRVASAPTLLAIPLFTFAGFILAESRTPQRLTRLTQALLGGVPGGLPWVVLVACAFFTAFTGASGVTIIALGGLLYPLMLKEMYGKNFSLGLMTSSGSLGLLFPPSLPLILYGLVAKVNIDQLFLAGVVPGVLMIIILAVYSMAQSKRFGIERTPFNWHETKRAVREAAWEIPLPFLVLYGIYGGIFTVTEAAAVTVVYVVAVECFVYRDIHPIRDMPEIMKKSMVLVGAILIILGTAMGFTSYLVDEQVPMQLLGFMKDYIDDQLTFLIVLNLFLLIVGCMMDIFSAIIVVVPLIVPIAQNFGVDMVHLGIIFLVNLEIGYSTPPVGLNLFIASSRFEEPVVRLYKATLPFLGLRLMGLMAVTYFPLLSLFLPNLFGS
ncbi:putative C4-dicarboxylate transporter, large subunit [Nitrospina gracilis 3/211]|uniref:Putative C4-dicarboxylate transporter, large subunit n=1 Tax=Nitrospina gracilis (strain 3/211) TaxID=1266370 RepID=M1Z2G5_NITG3|nr:MULTISPECIES: TRAP transporter large permease subunit [Nitrospina]MCF8724501.1 tripartite ATP-independent transporter DctM subunit [Nitrospina sp. Nb-3]CCQ91666.1 putative C4-dicarboxylate transporter, large subunit [Nitrospina gracilis 3/211]